MAGVEILESVGFVPILGSVALGRPSYTTPFRAIEHRADELVCMLRDDSIDAIWCLDGGAGASYLLPYLARAWDQQPWDTKKPIVGFSDVTFLLLYLVRLGHVAFFAPNVSCEREQDVTDLRLAAKLFAEERIPELQHTVEVHQHGSCEGTFLGGTFSPLVNMIGSPFCPNFEGSIVFFEEHGTHAPGQREYLLWQGLQGLELNGALQGAAGFAVGEIEIGGPYETDEDLFPDLWEVLDRTLSPMTTGPIVSGLEIGRSRLAQPLPLGTKALTRTIRETSTCCIEWSIPDWVWRR
jgi:muramoyltetrapeptide carboxypeptidase